MSDLGPVLQKYEFQKSLKDAHRYPFLEFFRIERFLTRPLAWLVVRAAYRSPIKPDHLTWASFAVGLAASAAFLAGSHVGFIAGGILIQIGSILDCADGMLARARGQCTERGAFLDLILDRIIDFIGLAALAAGTYKVLGSLAVLAVSLAAIALYYLQSTLYYLFLIYRRDRRMGRQAEVRGLSVFLTMILCILNRPQYVFYALLGQGLIWIPYLTARFFRPARD